MMKYAIADNAAAARRMVRVAESMILGQLSVVRGQLLGCLLVSRLTTDN
jgi:hypothetical protein